MFAKTLSLSLRLSLSLWKIWPKPFLKIDWFIILSICYLRNMNMLYFVTCANTPDEVVTYFEVWRWIANIKKHNNILWWNKWIHLFYTSYLLGIRFFIGGCSLVTFGIIQWKHFQRNGCLLELQMKELRLKGR